MLLRSWNKVTSNSFSDSLLLLTYLSKRWSVTIDFLTKHPWLGRACLLRSVVMKDAFQILVRDNPTSWCRGFEGPLLRDSIETPCMHEWTDEKERPL